MNVLFHFFGGVSSCLVHSFDHMDSGSQAGRSRSLAHQINRRLPCVKQHASAGAADVPAISSRIKDAVRNNHPVGPTWEVMVEGLERLAASDTTFAKQLALNSLALVSTEKYGLPVDSYCSINCEIFWN